MKNYAFGLAVAAALLIAGCAHAGKDGPPLTDGVYIAKGVCFGEGSCYRYWRASAPVDIRERPDPASRVIATVKPEEWVEAVDGQLRLLPLRGVVHTATKDPPLAVGDVVFMLEPQGEGFYTLWHDGKTLAHDWASGDAHEPITWEPARDPPTGVVVGWWLQLKLGDGRTGWVKDPSFECMGQLQGSAGCRD